MNEYRDYADVYWSAARELAGDRSNSRKWDLPILFLYRHALEFKVNAILIELGPERGLNAEDVVKRKHGLKAQNVRFGEVATRWGVELTQDFKELIAAWHDEDASGTVVRYPETWDRKHKGLKPQNLMHADAFDLTPFVDECELALTELTELLEEPASQFNSDLQNEIAREFESLDS